jgi:ribosomal-protein-serine acetyltransferase
VRGEFVGLIGLVRVHERTKSGELGYWVDRKAEGKGLVSRACAAMLDHAFGELGLRRVEIRLAASNSRSRAVPERLGFTLEGTARQAEPVGDRWEDLLVFGMLASEWKSRSP